MARSDRHGQRGQASRRDGRQPAAPSPVLTDEQRAQVEALLSDVPTRASALRAAADQNREAIAEALLPIREASDAVAVAFAAALGKQRGPAARDAADVAAAMGELDPRREVAREARRTRIRLRSVGAVSALTLSPVPAVVASESSSENATSAASPDAASETTNEEPMPFTPKLIEAQVTRSREEGEVTLVLGWQEGQDTNFLRGQVYALSFWSEGGGVNRFAQLEPMSRTRFQRETVEAIRADRNVEFVSITWAQARRLILDALAVNEWRGAAPDAEFQRHRAQLDARLLGEPETDEAQAAIAQEHERLAREGDRALIAPNLEPDELIANWIGAWSFGDYGLTYDLLADDHPIRQKQSRAEYIETRRLWAKEADPTGLRLTVVREQEQRASALWVPGAASALSATGRRDFEAFWSLILHDVEIGGQLDELPMATLISKETGRHWYWTGYSVSRDRTYGLPLISRARDEGAASQALTVEELQKRIAEAHTNVEKITQQPTPDPRSEEAAAILRTLSGALTAAMHYSDALSVRLPLDESIYRAAANDARSLANHERAAAILERMRGRFADDMQIRFELGVEQYLTAEQYMRQGQSQLSAAWLDRAIATMTAVATEDPTAEHLQGLGELLARQGHFVEAEQRLRQAIATDPERAALHSDLADALMGRASGEGLDDETPPDAEQRKALARQALTALRDAARIDSALPGLFTRMGGIYEALEQSDDALIAFEEAVRRDPTDAEASYALGSLLLSRRDPERARPLLETAVQLSPVSLPYRLNLAACYGALDRFADANRQLDVVDRLQPGLPQVAELRAILSRERKHKH